MIKILRAFITLFFFYQYLLYFLLVLHAFERATMQLLLFILSIKYCAIHYWQRYFRYIRQTMIYTFNSIRKQILDLIYRTFYNVWYKYVYLFYIWDYIMLIGSASFGTWDIADYYSKAINNKRTSAHENVRGKKTTENLKLSLTDAFNCYAKSTSHFYLHNDDYTIVI